MSVSGFKDYGYAKQTLIKKIKEMHDEAKEVYEQEADEERMGAGAFANPDIIESAYKRLGHMEGYERGMRNALDAVKKMKF